jgi:hypothetical protein
MADGSARWWTPIDARHDLEHHGGPLWVARELNGSISCLGQRIVGRLRSASGVHVGPSSHFVLATAIARHCSVGVRIQGLAFTGFIHPAVQELLDTAAESAGLMEPETPKAPVSTFGARSGGLRGLTEGGSRLREVGMNDKRKRSFVPPEVQVNVLHPKKTRVPDTL